MSPDADRYEAYYSEKLWALLPEVYRALDTDDPGAAGPLRELCYRIGAQAAILRRSIDRAWEDRVDRDVRRLGHSVHRRSPSPRAWWPVLTGAASGSTSPGPSTTGGEQGRGRCSSKSPPMSPGGTSASSRCFAAWRVPATASIRRSAGPKTRRSGRRAPAPEGAGPRGDTERNRHGRVRRPPQRSRRNPHGLAFRRVFLHCRHAPGRGSHRLVQYPPPRDLRPSTPQHPCRSRHSGPGRGMPQPVHLRPQRPRYPLVCRLFAHVRRRVGLPGRAPGQRPHRPPPPPGGDGQSVRCARASRRSTLALFDSTRTVRRSRSSALPRRHGRSPERRGRAVLPCTRAWAESTCWTEGHRISTQAITTASPPRSARARTTVASPESQRRRWPPGSSRWPAGAIWRDPGRARRHASTRW